MGCIRVFISKTRNLYSSCHTINKSKNKIVFHHLCCQKFASKNSVNINNCVFSFPTEMMEGVSSDINEYFVGGISRFGRCSIMFYSTYINYDENVSW